MEQQHGLLVVDKPRGLSSAQCTNRFKRLGQKKIGHAGTLDPMAQGVLLVLLGHATKISGYLMAGGVKAYQGTVRLGQTTDTWDADGQITAEAPWNHVTAEAVAAGLADYYKDAATVKVHALNEPLPENGLYSNAMAGTDRMELYLTVNAAGDQMMLVSLFDNLGKGSSGAAVQCMNLMLGFEETAGLE